MDEKIFNNLVNADFVADYEQKYAQIGLAEEKAIADGTVAEELCEQEVANVTNTMETFKLIVMEKLQSIEEKAQQELATAQEKYLADIKQCENRMNSAQKAFAKATKENSTKSTKLKNANTKVVAEIEKKHKAETTAAEKKQKEVIKKREKDFKEQADVMAKRHDEAKHVYEHSVANVNAKIKKSHDYYKKQEASSISAFESVKVVCEQSMQELQEQYNVAQNEFNEQIKNVTEKQRIKTLRTQLALAKSSYESGMTAKKGELATAKTIFDTDGKTVFYNAQWYKLSALDSTSGEIKWERFSQKGQLANHGAFWYRTNTPLYHEGKLYAFGFGHGAITDADSGDEFLHKPVSFKTEVVGQGIIDGNTLYVPTGKQGVVALDKDTLEEKWRYPVGGAIIYTCSYAVGQVNTVESSPVIIGNELVFAANDGYVYFYDKTKPELHQKIKLSFPTLTTPVFRNNYFFSAGFDGSVGKYLIPTK
ncbi:MAG: PQQ-binding-like beta-propeller repeat protein [Clostridia bacterium]|nr:PQQ-binding-like beta-propeller repeat protein [Clostridia bacterium]